MVIRVLCSQNVSLTIFQALLLVHLIAFFTNHFDPLQVSLTYSDNFHVSYVESSDEFYYFFAFSV